MLVDLTTLLDYLSSTMISAELAPGGLGLEETAMLAQVKPTELIMRCPWEACK